jgi:flagellar biosynthetic protein FliR
VDLRELLATLLRDPAVRTAVLLAGRVLPVLLLTPIAGGPSMPRTIRILLAIVFVGLLVPTVVPQGVATTADGLAPALLHEVLHGLVLAVGVQIVLEVLGVAGALVDFARDASIASVLDPVLHRDQPVTASFWSAWFPAVFFTTGGHLALIDAFGRGLAVRPLGTARHAEDWPALVGDLLREANGALLVGLQVALPLLLVVLVGKLAVAAVERSAKPLQNTNSLVPWLGLAALVPLSQQVHGTLFPWLGAALASVLAGGA